MAWSTRELAELANTTVNAVRYYHRSGLLEAPERASNGYKQYEVAHLVRLLQIRRMRDLGIPVSQIADIGSDVESGSEELRRLDAELESQIEHLTRMRTQLGEILEHHASADVPAGFAGVSKGLNATQSSLLSVYSTVFGPEALEQFREAMATPDSTDQEFEELPADADDRVVESLAARMAPPTRAASERFPLLNDPLAHSPLGPKAAARTIADALVDLYNPAQLRVLKRVSEILDESGTDA